MEIYYKPKTALGKWSTGLFVGMIAFFVLSFYLLSDLPIPTWQASFMLYPLALIAGIFSFFTGIISIIKSKERSVIVYTLTIAVLIIVGFCIYLILSAFDIPLW